MPTLPKEEKKWPVKRVKTEYAKAQRKICLMRGQIAELHRQISEIEINIMKHCPHENTSYESDPAGSRGITECDDCGKYMG